MTPEMTQYLTRELSVNGITNTFFNGVIAWLLLKDKGLLHWWGDHSFGVDVLATAFILPFIVTLIVIPMQRRKVAKAKVAIFEPSRNNLLERCVASFPQSLFLSALLFGLAGFAIIAPLTLLGISLFGVESFSPGSYSIFKGLWAGTMAALLVSPMILVGLRAQK